MSLPLHDWPQTLEVAAVQDSLRGVQACIVETPGGWALSAATFWPVDTTRLGTWHHAHVSSLKANPDKGIMTVDMSLEGGTTLPLVLHPGAYSLSCFGPLDLAGFWLHGLVLEARRAYRDPKPCDDDPELEL